jgi:hypothetical protein
MASRPAPDPHPEPVRALAKKREIGALLESRMADYLGGQTTPLDGEEVFQRLRRKIAERIAKGET